MLNRQRGQGGHTLIEALVAMLVLALGIGGLAWSQARLVVHGRDANGRAAAVLLAADLSDRMAFNVSTAVTGGYSLGWNETPATLDCHAATCTGTEQAQSDLAGWRRMLARTLPAGNAAVFRSTIDPRQIGIAISWGHDPLVSTTPVETQAPANCPPGQLCHVVYVQP